VFQYAETVDAFNTFLGNCNCGFLPEELGQIVKPALCNNQQTHLKNLNIEKLPKRLGTVRYRTPFKHILDEIVCRLAITPPEVQDAPRVLHGFSCGGFDKKRHSSKF
jgi:hypothetical protein